MEPPLYFYVWCAEKSLRQLQLQLQRQLQLRVRSALVITYVHIRDLKSLDSARQAVNKAWIGANDVATEGEFLWVEDGSSVQSADWQWGTAEPNNFGQGGEDCVFLAQRWAGRWADLNCAQSVPSWCQRPAGERGVWGKSAAGNSEWHWAIPGVFRRVLL